MRVLLHGFLQAAEVRDGRVTEVVVATKAGLGRIAGRVFIEVGGEVQLTNVRFRDNAQLMNICQRIVSQVGRRVDESSPICDARLPDGSRVGAFRFKTSGDWVAARSAGLEGFLVGRLGAPAVAQSPGGAEAHAASAATKPR